MVVFLGIVCVHINSDATCSDIDKTLIDEHRVPPLLFLGRLLGYKGCVSSPFTPVASPKSLNLIAGKDLQRLLRVKP